MQDYGVILPNELVTMARGLTLIESVAHNLNPEIDVLASVKKVAAEIAKEKMNPKTYIKSKKSNLIMYGHMLQSLPKLLTRMIHKIENEELQLKLEVDINDKVTIVALVCALIIGSSIVSFGPRIFDMPLISLILGIIGIKKFL